MNKIIRILGTRGIPAQHGGFETFAEHLALYLVSKGWDVTVYCQEESNKRVFEDRWNGVRLVYIPVRQKGAYGTIVFDWLSTWHAVHEKGLVLILGYNTAAFSALYRLKGITNLINMDGIEWQRQKWNVFERIWLYLNERLGCWLGNQLIADHPEIKQHLVSRISESKITMIPYGADQIEVPDLTVMEKYGLVSHQYVLVIARPEPENSIREIVLAFSRKPREVRLVVLGQYDYENTHYHRQVLDAASDEIVFLGAIYDKQVVSALRFHSLLYVHGHQVGGTNPSLVEALGAGSPVLAHDNRFNRWVAGPGAQYFIDEQACAEQFDVLLNDQTNLVQMRLASIKRHEAMFTWKKVLGEYEELLEHWV
jgi:glycosyltransferase involved in cell wall biosynthesis